MSSDTGSGGANPFLVTVDGYKAHMRVISLRGREAVSRPYRFDLTITSTEASPPPLGATAAIFMHVGSGDQRIVCGIIGAVEAQSLFDLGRYIHGLRIVPRLARLKRRRTSRVFQNKTVPEIVAAVFDGAGVAHKSALTGTYFPRTYCVQYQETDLEFVGRVLAEEGIFYSFEHAKEETVVLGDSTSYAPIQGDPTLHYRFGEDADGLTREHRVKRFALRRVIRSGKVLHADYDFHQPKLDLHADAKTEDYDDPGSGLELYEHEGKDAEPDVDASTAQRRLDQHRRRATAAEGASHCRRLSPGLRFALAEHDLTELNADYVVESIEHIGRSPEVASIEEQDTYSNTFTALPASVAIRPKRPVRTLKQVTETALVVGPTGQEIYTDELGRVKVQFFWDRTGKKNEHSSCWVRVAQAWAGANWGTQFIPRVGMEVVVTFLGGDVDRPLVTGCVPNEANKPPFELPKEGSMSGVRTQSTPATSRGGNELSFQDRRGAEEIVLLAARNLRETVNNDHILSVSNNQSTTIAKNRTSTVRGLDSTTIGRDRTVSVDGDDAVTIKQNRSVRIEGGLTEVVKGRSSHSYDGGTFNRITGHSLSVGNAAPEAPPSTYASHSSGDWTAGSDDTVRLIAEKRIILECGTSQIVLTPTSIRLTADDLVITGKNSASFMAGKGLQGPALHLGDEAEIVTKRIRILTPDASLELEKNASLRGTTIRLNCDDRMPDPTVPTAATEETRPFAIKVSDDEFKPYTGKHYLLVAGAKKYEGTVGAGGAISETIAKTAATAEVTVWVDTYPTGRRKVWMISVADDLLPATSSDGAKTRLTNLGYVVGVGKDLDDVTRAALREFQNDHVLAVTGELDASTVEKLTNIHGH